MTAFLRTWEHLHHLPLKELERGHFKSYHPLNSMSGEEGEGNQGASTWEKEAACRHRLLYLQGSFLPSKRKAGTRLPSKGLLVLTGWQNWLKDAEIIFLEKLRSSRRAVNA